MRSTLPVVLGLMLTLMGCSGNDSSGSTTSVPPPSNPPPSPGPTPTPAPSSIFSAVQLSTLAGDTTVSVAVAGTTAYALSSSRSVLIADISDRSAPSLLGQLDLCSGTPSTQTCNSSFNAIAVANQYAVAVGSKLQMVDVRSPAQPVLSGSLALTGIASGITVVGLTAYVAAGSQGLVIVNIADPANPVVLGQLTAPAYGIRVVGQTAYVANGLGLQIVDVSNSAAPSTVGTVAFTTASAASRDVEVVGDIAYVAARLGGIQVVNISNPSSPSVVGVTSTTGDSRALAVQNNVLYVAEGAGGLALVDITSPGVLALRTRVATNSGLGEAQAVTVNGDIAYVTYGSDGLVLMDSAAAKDTAILVDMTLDGAAMIAGSGDALYVSVCYGTSNGPLQVVDIADPVLPVISRTISTGGCVFDMRIVGSTAFIANTSQGLQTINVASGSMLSQSTAISGGPAVGVAVSGNTAYVTNGDGFVVADISNPSSPGVLGSIITKKDAKSVVTDGSFAYVVQGQDGIGIFNIANPGNPQQLSTINPSPVSAFASHLIKVGSRLYVAHGGTGLAIVDVANPVVPRVLAITNDADDNAQKLAMDGAIAYVANGYGGVKIFDTSDPTNPTLIGRVRTAGYVVDVHIVGRYVYIADVLGISVIRAF